MARYRHGDRIGPARPKQDTPAKSSAAIRLTDRLAYAALHDLVYRCS